MAIYWVDITVVLRHLCLFKFQISRYLWFSLIVLKYWVGNKVKLNSAVWSFSAVRFSIYSAVWSIIRPSGFLFFRPSGFGRMYKSGSDTDFNCGEFVINLEIGA